jgi:hypothetical protein
MTGHDDATDVFPGEPRTLSDLPRLPGAEQRAAMYRELAGHPPPVQPPADPWAEDTVYGGRDMQRIRQQDRAGACLDEFRTVSHLADTHPTRLDVVRRAAIILRAEPWAPTSERYFGIRLAAALEGTKVTCRECKRKWTAIPEDPVYDTTTANGGLCFTCVLPATRGDNAQHVLEGVIVPPGKDGA